MASLDYLDYALHDNRLIGVKIDHAGVWLTGIFCDRALLMSVVNKYNGKGGVYITLNRLSSEAKPLTLERRVDVLRNDDFSHITRLFFDFDSSKKPASEEELIELAKAKNDMVKYLDLKGFPTPLIGFSGNGWHVQYRTLIERTEYESFKDDLYFGLKEKFPLGFDVSVRNPGRVSRLYGTINLKCHRQTSCKLPISGWRITRQEVVKGVVSPRAKVAVLPKHSRPSESLVSLFLSHKMVIRERRGNYQVICPWESEHTTNKRGGTYVLTSRGFEAFYCHHSHCQHRRNRHVFWYFRGIRTNPQAISA